MIRIAIFASGAGTNAAKIIDFFRNHPSIAIKLIVCNRPGAGVIQVAEKENIPVLMVDKERFFSGDGYLADLKNADINFIVLAGFLWKIPQALIQAYPGAIINIHPALLPKYGGKGMYGMKVHQAVINAKDAESGITIHYVDEHYDNGDIIFQEKCAVEENDTPESLASKIHALEHLHFPRIVEQVSGSHFKKMGLMCGRLILIMLVCLACFSAIGQVRISGRVYDISKVRSLEAVSVLTTSGLGTASDSLGRYSIVVRETDSIWFSYLNKPTPKYAVKDIQNRNNFEISLHVGSTELKEIRFSPPNYRIDSIQNRRDYAKAFNFRKPGIGSSLNLGPSGGVGLDLDEFISIFQFRRNKRMSAFRDRLLQEEEDRYIDHRFNRALIIKLTGLRGEPLNDFMARYRPDLEFVDTSTDYEFQDYIKKCFSHYQRYLNMMKQLKGE